MTTKTNVRVGPNFGLGGFIHPVNVSTAVLEDPNRTFVFYDDDGVARREGNILGLNVAGNSGISAGEMVKTTSGDILEITGPTRFRRLQTHPQHKAVEIADWQESVKGWEPKPDPVTYRLGPDTSLSNKKVFLIAAYMSDLDGKQLNEDVRLTDEKGRDVTVRLNFWDQVECKDGRMMVDTEWTFSRKLEYPARQKDIIDWHKNNP